MPLDRDYFSYNLKCLCVLYSAGPTTWSDIWIPTLPLQNFVSTSLRSLCFCPGEAQPSPLNLPLSHVPSRQEHHRNAYGRLCKRSGVILYKHCLFVITRTHTSCLPACIRTLLRLYLTKPVESCLSFLRCGHSTVLLVILPFIYEL